MKQVIVKRIDLHGMSHQDAVNIVEDTMLVDSTRGNVELRVITGKSGEMQKVIIDEVCKKHNFPYFISALNPGEMVIEYTKI